jgi:hypothetical protein
MFSSIRQLCCYFFLITRLSKIYILHTNRQRLVVLIFIILTAFCSLNEGGNGPRLALSSSDINILKRNNNHSFLSSRSRRSSSGGDDEFVNNVNNKNKTSKINKNSKSSKNFRPRNFDTQNVPVIDLDKLTFLSDENKINMNENNKNDYSINRPEKFSSIKTIDDNNEFNSNQNSYFFSLSGIEEYREAKVFDTDEASLDQNELSDIDLPNFHDFELQNQNNPSIHSSSSNSIVDLFRNGYSYSYEALKSGFGRVKILFLNAINNFNDLSYQLYKSGK